MKWIETTLRKGTKKPKVCRDMFITDSRGNYAITTVKNGRVFRREKINSTNARKLVNEHDLQPVSTIFSDCYTYRTEASNKMIAELFRSYRLNKE